MLSSWVSGIQTRSQSLRTPSWYESEISASVSVSTMERQQYLRPTRRVGLLPKIRRAFEVATHASNGSFPVQEPMAPPSPSEETAFEACDSFSQCQSVAESFATFASYDMSRIDDPDAIEACDSVAPSPTASETDSLFGVSLRDMVQMDGKVKERDDVWLLSCDDDIKVDCPPPAEIKSPTGIILSRVPVLVLPGHPDTKLKHNEAVASKWEDDDDNNEEEEIDFGDNTFLISATEDHFSDNRRKEGCSDENQTTNVLKRFNKGRDRAQMLRKNFKGIWSSSTDCGKRVKQAQRRYRYHNTKKRVSQSKSPRSSRYDVDPLKELSKCHERMLENQQPFSPKRAFSRIRDQMRRNNASEDGSFRQHSALLSASSSVSSAGVSSDDEASEVTLPSTLFPNISGSTTLDACPTDKEELLERTESDSSESSLSFSQGTLDVDNRSTTTKEPRPPTSFKIKFKSPRNDTPRIVLGDEIAEADSGEEPRALYTDEGYVEAYIHPKNSCRSMDSRGSLNHVFHSELSTLYEVSSSLESASFSTVSGSRTSTEATSLDPNAGNFPSSAPILHTGGSSSITTTSENSSNQESMENRPPVTEKASIRLTTHQDQHPNPIKSGSVEGNGQLNDDFEIDDCEVKMRWEFSLGLMEDTGHWRRSDMSLMNTEELSHDYVAEI